VIFERIGYAKVTHGLDAWQDDRIAVDAKMTAVALALDELVVTGAATAENDGALPLGQGSWTAIANDSVSPAGFPVRRLPDAPIETLELATFGSRTAERVTQSLPDGTRVVVWQARGPILLASSDLPAGHTVVHGTVGEVSVAVSGPLDPARLQAVLREVR
jgi:hypothetical protein